MSQGHSMSYIELVKNGADPTEIQQYLAQGEQVAITIRLPENLRNAAKAAAVLQGTNFSAMVRAGLIAQLADWAEEVTR